MRLLVKIYSFSEISGREEASDTINTKIYYYFASEALGDRYYRCVAVYGILNIIILFLSNGYDAFLVQI